jgi:hypothetical protein
LQETHTDATPCLRSELATVGGELSETNRIGSSAEGLDAMIGWKLFTKSAALGGPLLMSAGRYAWTSGCISVILTCMESGLYLER